MLVNMPIVSNLVCLKKYCDNIDKDHVYNREEGKDQESIQSNTIPDPEHDMGK